MGDICIVIPMSHVQYSVESYSPSLLLHLAVLLRGHKPKVGRCILNPVAHTLRIHGLLTEIETTLHRKINKNIFFNICIILR
jgi:hypothetical protein